MKIAFIALGFAPLRMSGLDIGGERLVRALLEAGHEVTVIAAARQAITETLSRPGLRIHRVHMDRSNWIGFARRAAQSLDAVSKIQAFDVVHFWDVHFAFAYSGRFVASLHQSFRQRSSLLRSTTLSRRLLYASYYAWARRFAEIPSLRRAAGLMAVSRTTREEFIRNYSIPENRIALAQNVIDTDFFRPSHDGVMLKDQLGISPNERVILHVGFVTPRKGLDNLARAVSLVRPAPRLVIVGKWSKNYRAHFLELLGDGASRLVEAGFVPDEMMPAYYSLADVTVSTSLLEGFGLPMAESLACGTPVVATAAGASPEIVGPGGILVPVNDHIALASAVSRLLSDTQLRGDLARQGREHIGRQFSIQAGLDGTLEAYRRFVGLSA